VFRYKRRIFLITDGEKDVKAEKHELKSVIETMNANDTRLNVITLDFCNDLGEDDEDEDEEIQEEVKSKDKKSK
jgi:hypothetical protein